MIATDATLFLTDFHHLQRIRAEEIAFYNNENKNSRPFSLRARECCFHRLNNDEVILFENLDSFLCCLTSLFIFHIIRRQIFLSRTHSKGGKNFTVLNSVSEQEKHRSRATFLIGNGIKYSGEGIYNSKYHMRL